MDFFFVKTLKVQGKMFNFRYELTTMQIGKKVVKLIERKENFLFLPFKMGLTT
jgi:hypothetical protein